jgi:hypothetical protein
MVYFRKLIDLSDQLRITHRLKSKQENVDFVTKN